MFLITAVAFYLYQSSSAGGLGAPTGRIDLEEVFEVIRGWDKICDILEFGFDRKRKALWIRSSVITAPSFTLAHSRPSCWVVVASGRDAISRDYHIWMQELPDPISVT